MGIKRILSNLFSGFKKTPEAPETPPASESVSPFAKFLQPEGAQLSHSQEPGQAEDIFLLDSVASKLVDTVGLYFSAQASLLVRDPQNGKAGQLMRWGEERALVLPLLGNWFGTGIPNLAFYDPLAGLFAFPKKDEGEEPPLRFLFGPGGPDWIPLAGDWYGRGRDGIGIYNPEHGLFMLHGELTPENAEIGFHFGPKGRGCIPLVGDWNGDGTDGIGVYEPSQGIFMLRDSLSEGSPDHTFRIEGGGSGCLPFVGDWNGDNRDGVGLYDPEESLFLLRNLLTPGAAESRFRFGPRGVGAKPLSVPWKRLHS